MNRSIAALGIFLLGTSGCDKPTLPAPRPVTVDVASWPGRWNGPEGTFLELKRQGEEMVVTIQNLDGPKTYSGRIVRDHVEFERDGKVESIRATGGPETGMKWLVGKADCLTIRTGEGFCRD